MNFRLTWIIFRKTFEFAPNVIRPCAFEWDQYGLPCHELNLSWSSFNLVLEQNEHRTEPGEALEKVQMRFVGRFKGNFELVWEQIESHTNLRGALKKVKMYFVEHFAGNLAFL